MEDANLAIQKLKALGLTASEARVYLATLQEAGTGPVSAYKVAQTLGKDPANLGKTLAALERQGAVRAVQDRPRLYLPVAPDDFTEAVLSRLQGVREDLVAQLKEYPISPPSGMTLALRNNEQALAQAAELLKTCTSELLIYASAEVMDYLGRDFGELATRSQARIRYLGPEPSGIALAEETLVPRQAEQSDHPTQPWLHMVIDRKTWLMACFNRSEGPEFPCGWWGDDAAMAQVLAGPFSVACGPTAGRSFTGGLDEAVEAAGLPKEVSPAPPARPQDIPAPVPDDISDEGDADTGLHFVVRHEAQEDGEQED